METRRSIAVIDLKAFYSYVECIDRGLDPWKTPLVVADKERGTNTIILSVTPYLKQLGVPSRLRLKELPKGINYIFATPRMARYIEMSSKVVRIIMSYFAQEDIHVYSIDEAFIDLTTYLTYYKKTAIELVEYIINIINDKTGLQATGGIGDNFFLAKVALDIFAKHEPNGIGVMHKEDIKEKLWPITPLVKIWGIGPRLEARLNNLNIFTMGELANSDPDFLKAHFGVIGEQLHNHANGIDDSYIRDKYVPKEHSLSIGQVLFKDYSKEECKVILREMSDDLAKRMRDENKLAGVVSLWIGYSKNMGGFGRQMSLISYTDSNEKLYEAVMELYNKYVIDLPIRRVNINFGKLKNNKNIQLNLFEDSKQSEDKRKLEKTLDFLQDKYGKNIILRASALTEDSTIIERHNFIGGHRS